MPSVRIITGEFGGRRIEAPDGRRTHPMGDRPRSALFNIIQGDIEGADVLDVFAGTGALGLEALSRGARSVTFIERDHAAQTAIAHNIVTLGLEERAKLIRTSAANWLSTAGDQQFDLIFADPPYHDPQLSTVSQILGLLKPGALMVLSVAGSCERPTRPGVVVVDNRSYGAASLTFYRRNDS